MKKLFLASFFVFFSITAWAFTPTIGKYFSYENLSDINFLNGHFETSTQKTVDIVLGLNSEQIRFTPENGGWSIGEIVEHLILTEQMILGMVMGQLEQDPNPERRGEIEFTDEMVLSATLDRSSTVDAPEFLIPEGRFNDAQTSIQEFLENRKLYMNLIKNHQLEDLRNRVIDTPFGPMDLYQFTLFASAHSERHLLQMHEILADPGFPRG